MKKTLDTPINHNADSDKLTPGLMAPWKAHDRGDNVLITTADGVHGICRVIAPSDKTRKEIAKVLLAAPDLLAACELFMAWCKTDDHLPTKELLDAMQDAIAKAQT